MGLRTITLGMFILSLPVTVEVPTSPDSVGRESETRITVIGGAGRYALIDRGCHNEVLRTHPVRFRETGGSIEHRFSGGLTVGLRGGVVRERPESVAVTVPETEVTYGNPFVALETPRLGVGVGWVWGEDELRFGSRTSDRSQLPSFHVRIGRLERTYVRLSLMEGVPLYSGGGFVEVGVGGRAHPRWDYYAGFNSGPFDGGGLGVKVDYRVLPHWAISGRARTGYSGGETQNGAGLGVTYSSLRRTTAAVREPDR